MKKRRTPRFLLAFATTVALFLGPAHSALATIEITDGAGGGDCEDVGSWDDNTKTCRLKKDIVDNVLISSDSVTLECKGHSVSSPGAGNGITLESVYNVTVEECVVGHFSFGIRVNMGGKNVASHNTTSSNGTGILLIGTSFNAVTMNNSTNDTGVGIGLSGSSSNYIEHNTIRGSMSFGIGLQGGNNNNTIRHNWVTELVSSGIGILLGSGIGNLVEDNELTDNDGPGIQLFDETGSIVRHNTVNANGALGNRAGIFLDRSVSNTITQNTTNRNFGDGILLADDADSNTLIKNKSRRNGGFGYFETAGATGNMYVGNQCKFNASGGASPTGLCTPQM